MGRSRRRRATKNRQNETLNSPDSGNSETSPSNSHLKRSPNPLHCSSVSQVRLPSNEELTELKNDVIHCIELIYTEFFHEFLKRKDKYTSSTGRCEELEPRYNLVVEQKYRHKIREKLIVLGQNNSASELLTTYEGIVINFVEKLSQVLSTIKSCSNFLQVVCLTEASQISDNAANEMTKITQPLFPDEISCRILNQKILYERVLVKYSKLVDYARQHIESHPSHEYLVDQYTELKQYVISEEIGSLASFQFNHEYMQFVDSDEESISSEYTQNMTVDQIVKFIIGEESDGESNSTAESQRSPKGYKSNLTEVDLEIKAFRQMLRQYKPWKSRIKARLSPKFVEGLQEQLKAKSNQVIVV